jgi:hypothetical protein
VTDKGVLIKLFDAQFHAGPDGIRVVVDDWTVTIDDSGVNVANEHPAFDLTAYPLSMIKPKFVPPKIKLPDLPPLPKLPLPSLDDLPGLGDLPGVPSLGDLPSVPGLGSLPSVPKLGKMTTAMSMPNMPKMGSLMKSKEAEGSIEDHLLPGETVADQVDLQRRRKLFAKKTVHLVRTSTNRLFFCSKLYGQKRGDDLVLGKGSTVAPVKGNILKVKSADGKEITMTFKNPGERDPWKAKFESIIESLP